MGLGGGRVKSPERSRRARVAEVNGKENQEEGLALYVQEEGDRDEAARVQQSGLTITNAAA